MGKAAIPEAPLVWICGDDEFAVKQRSRQIFDAWCALAGGMDHEIIDGSAQNGGEALSALGKLREALNTLPFFGGKKVVWFQGCSFVGDDRTSGSSAVTDSLARLAEELKVFRWDGVQLLISSVKPDKRRIFSKTLEKIGVVETFVALSIDDRDWASTAEAQAYQLLRAEKKDADDESIAELVQRVGPNLRALNNEVEKLVVYVGDRTQITLKDVQTITTKQKQARAFALAEALGDRSLPRLVRTLDEELWEMRVDKKKSEIGLLYGLITKVRALLFLKELRTMGRLKPTRDYNGFKAQIEQLDQSGLPQDKKFNPLAGHPFTLFQAFKQTDNYESSELVRAMGILLQCNRKFVSSDVDEGLVLQQSLLEIVGLRPAKAPSMKA